MVLAVAHGVCLFLSLFAVPRRFSLQPSCHLAVVPLSSLCRRLSFINRVVRPATVRKIYSPDNRSKFLYSAGSKSLSMLLLLLSATAAVQRPTQRPKVSHVLLRASVNGEEPLRCAPCDVRILGATASPIIQRTAQVAAGQIIARYKEERCAFMQSVAGLAKRPASAASGSARDAAVELLLALTLNLPCWVLLGVVLSSWDVKML